MKIRVVGEGTRDVSTPGKHRGALCVLVERALGVPEWVVLEGRTLPRLHGRGGITEKAKLAVTAAAGYDGIVVVVDNDGAPPSERIQALRKGAQAAKSATPCALGLAIQEFEAWMIADEKALQSGLRLERPVKRQKKPEEIRDPKKVLNEIAGRRVTGEELARVSREIDMESLRKRCPKGYGRFEEELKERIGPVFGTGA
ncbi:MAG: DUF4276 family protein [Deltaproteobacteria bacterium]|nr:DUF4276 family protein [Deltaproteobacteria bacterium]